jgi:hypothetical protein
VLKARGTLEKRLASQGVTVEWLEFPAGPQLLEGLNAGAIDVGTVGETPPIFAQAAGVDFVYIGNEPPAPRGEAIVVLPDSPIRTLAQLRGKKVALNKGSNVHYLLVKALEHAGIPYTDIQPIFLTPADARAAFVQRNVDAWVIWDPYLAAAERQLGARVVANGEGLVRNTQYYLAARRYARAAADPARVARRSRRGRSLGPRSCRRSRRATVAARRARHGHARSRIEAHRLRRAAGQRRNARLSAEHRRCIQRAEADSRPRERRRRSLSRGCRRATRERSHQCAATRRNR